MRASLLGCLYSLYTHSNPVFLKKLGARGIIPAMKSNVPPTPIANFTDGNLERFSVIHFS